MRTWRRRGERVRGTGARSGSASRRLSKRAEGVDGGGRRRRAAGERVRGCLMATSAICCTARHLTLLRDSRLSPVDPLKTVSIPASPSARPIGCLPRPIPIPSPPPPGLPPSIHHAASPSPATCATLRARSQLPSYRNTSHTSPSLSPNSFSALDYPRPRLPRDSLARRPPSRLASHDRPGAAPSRRHESEPISSPLRWSRSARALRVAPAPPLSNHHQCIVASSSRSRHRLLPASIARFAFHNCRNPPLPSGPLISRTPRTPRPPPPPRARTLPYALAPPHRAHRAHNPRPNPPTADQTRPRRPRPRPSASPRPRPPVPAPLQHHSPVTRPASSPHSSPPARHPHTS
ncbi:hypothetical protein HETIRDRAFT_321105 [Heterobasidion irregulare TC 32-1]|uniref:Uncharacterized protein n=1 Tax=Heterobasidion irregulare (strain TC 32-1) TaxID=747525 RepID=W4K607_HETIT|nr:uncharacterized protein HETIRDRAFT_321105 [Heterobasidion irregulare TC 32-1]ETW80491.1 hypothetical protein HETIRDRAFT_321105 [Heterobasidion irregulare TC 32-1]